MEIEQLCLFSPRPPHTLVDKICSAHVLSICQLRIQFKSCLTLVFLLISRIIKVARLSCNQYRYSTALSALSKTSVAIWSYMRSCSIHDKSSIIDYIHFDVHLLQLPESFPFMLSDANYGYFYLRLAEMDSGSYYLKLSSE